MQKLSDILANGSAETLRKQWGETEAAGEFEPLPAGEYVARIIGGELTTSRTNATPGYKLTFRVLEGEHEGRQFWHDIWLTEAALPMAKARPGEARRYRPGPTRATAAAGHPLPRETRLAERRRRRGVQRGSPLRRGRHRHAGSRTPLHRRCRRQRRRGRRWTEFRFGFRIVGDCCRRTAASRLARRVRRLCRLRPARRS